jgi:hypothetical protein
MIRAPSRTKAGHKTTEGARPLGMERTPHAFGEKDK